METAIQLSPAQIFQQFFRDYPLGATENLIEQIPAARVVEMIDAAWKLTGAANPAYILSREDEAMMECGKRYSEWLTEREFLNPAKAFIPFFNYQLPGEWKDSIRNNKIVKEYYTTSALLIKMLQAARLISLREDTPSAFI